MNFEMLFEAEKSDALPDDSEFLADQAGFS